MHQSINRFYRTKETLEPIEATKWYIQCRELEGDMYYRNFFEPVDQESLSEISASTAKAWRAMLDAVGYKSTYERKGDNM